MLTKTPIDMVEGLTTALGGKAPTGSYATTTGVTAEIAAAVAAGIAALPPVTAWVAYTPTIVGMGTVSNVIFRSRRVGSNLEIRGTFTSGTHTAVNASITLGYNGTNGGITAASWITSRQVAGAIVISATTASSFYALVLGADGLINIGLQSNGTIGLTPTLGTGIQSTLNFTVQASIPIQGW